MSVCADLSSARFWKTFKKQNWEKKATLIKKAQSPIFQINADATFQFLLLYSDYCRKVQKTDGLKLYVNGQLQYESELLEALPIKSDKSLLGYHERMAKVYDDYCLVCDELSQGSGDQWNLLKKFLRPLFQEVGIPNKYAEMGLYIGNYKKTPFGVHVDGCGVFSFPVVGNKKFRIWDPVYVAKHPDLVESFYYDKHKKNSQLMEVGPGDFSYWPSNAWHIAESDGRFSATWSLGIWLDESFSEMIIKQLSSLLVEKLQPYSNKKSLDYSVSSSKKIPKSFSETIKRIRGLSESELEDTLTRSWLKTQSKIGFKSPPLPRRDTPLKSASVLSLYADDNLFWTELQNGKIVVGINGVVVEYRKTASMLKLLKKINANDSVVFGRYQGHESNLLRKLYQNFVLRLDSPI